VSTGCSWPWYVPCIFNALVPRFLYACYPGPRLLKTLPLTLRPFDEGCRKSEGSDSILCEAFCRKFWRQLVAIDWIARYCGFYIDYLSCGAHVSISRAPVTLIPACVSNLDTSTRSEVSEYFWDVSENMLSNQFQTSICKYGQQFFAPSPLNSMWWCGVYRVDMWVYILSLQVIYVCPCVYMCIYSPIQTYLPCRLYIIT